MNVVKRSGSSEILHDVVEHKGVLNLAGVVAEDLSQGMAGQAKQVFEQIDELLKAHGSDRNHLLSALIFITDMKLNDAMPDVSVDPETYEVRANGRLLTCEPAKELPMAQRYFLY